MRIIPPDSDQLTLEAHARFPPFGGSPLDAQQQVDEELAGSPFDGAQVAQALKPEKLSGPSQMARALRNPNFRLFWSGNFLSNIGTWMQNVAQGWLVLLLTNSAFWLGVVGFAGSIPFLVFTLFGGVIADRVDKRRLLLVTQTVMMLLAFLLATLAWLKIIKVWEVAAIAFLNGVAMAMNAPSYQAMVPKLVSVKTSPTPLLSIPPSSTCRVFWAPLLAAMRWCSSASREISSLTASVFLL